MKQLVNLSHHAKTRRMASSYSGPPLTSVSDLLPLSQATGTLHLLRGPLRYYHYGVDGFADHGWGCGYRTVQSMFSWLAPELPVPSIADMQRSLTQAGSGVGPRGFIGVVDAVVLLGEHGSVGIQHLRRGGDWSSLAPDLSAHWDGGGGPVMVGGGEDVYSKTVVGVREAVGDAPAALLVLDPHCTSRVLAQGEDPARLWAEGWVAWRPVDTLLRTGSFYNVGFARRADGVEAKREPPLAAGGDGGGDDSSVDWGGLIEVVESG